MAKKRNYKREYQTFHATPQQIANRSKRNSARRRMSQAGKVHKGDGREVDHIKPLSRGGSNNSKNLRVVSRTTNRRKGKK